MSSTYHYTTAQCPYFNAELDVFEGQGTEPTVFYGALHRNTNGVCGVPDESNDSNTWQPQPFDLTAGFHVYAAKWTATEVIWYVDDKELMRWPAYAGSTDQAMYIMFDMWIGGWTSDTVKPGDSLMIQGIYAHTDGYIGNVLVLNKGLPQAQLAPRSTHQEPF